MAKLTKIVGMLLRKSLPILVKRGVKASLK